MPLHILLCEWALHNFSIPSNLSTAAAYVVVLFYELSFSLNMALNPQHEDIGKGFVQQYYPLFDNPVQRAKFTAPQIVLRLLKAFKYEELLKLWKNSLALRFKK
uniref:Uncharacterized protein n=1 Tax=Glossina austeni TaxID=7395 RepID=A0A1A9UX81_GLOAU